MQSLFFFLQKKLKPLCTQNKKVSIWRLLLPNKISCWECVESSALCVKLMRVVSVTLHLVLWYTLQTVSTVVKLPPSPTSTRNGKSCFQSVSVKCLNHFTSELKGEGNRSRGKRNPREECGLHGNHSVSNLVELDGKISSAIPFKDSLKPGDTESECCSVMCGGQGI